MNTCLIFTHPINAFAIHVCNKILRPNLDEVVFDLDHIRQFLDFKSLKRTVSLELLEVRYNSHPSLGHCVPMVHVVSN